MNDVSGLDAHKCSVSRFILVQARLETFPPGLSEMQHMIEM